MTDYVCSPEKCKGCGLCQNICPIGCITLKYNLEGFLEPVKDMSRCTQCGLCLKHCIAEKNPLKPSVDSGMYCAQSRDAANLSNCTSGGIFGELAKAVIEKYDGVVYGAAYADSYCVKHVRAETLSDTLPMHYSKYVQSDTSGIYKSVKQDLVDGRTVLFTGTPCQIAALKCFLGKAYENLICMDIVCHGVMSTSVLRDYIRYVLPTEKEYERIGICFRSKEIPGSNASFVLTKDGAILHHEPFYGSKGGIGRAFGGLFANRLSCTDCAFRQVGRYSDITAGDYVKENAPSNLAHSLVLVNTEKGRALFDQLPIEKQPLTDAERAFTAERLNRHAPRNKKRDLFFRMYVKEGIDETTTAIWESKSSSKLQRICAKCCRILGRIFRS